MACGAVAVSDGNLLGYLGGQLAPPFACSLTRLGAVQVRTPLSYPDGGLIDVYVEDREAGYVVTDSGEAWVQLQNQTLCDGLTQDQRRDGQEACRGWGATLDDVQIVLRCSEAAELPEAIEHLSSAAAEVSAIWLQSMDQGAFAGSRSRAAPEF